MAGEVKLSFEPLSDVPRTQEIHRLGNIVDGIWKERLILEHGAIVEKRYIATMAHSLGRKLRKKETDTLRMKLKLLDPQLDAKIES